MVPIQDFNATGAGLALFAGDRLKFECRTDKWGIDGGIDEVRRLFKDKSAKKENISFTNDKVHDLFGCMPDGYLNLPDTSKGEKWPTCKPQMDSE